MSNIDISKISPDTVLRIADAHIEMYRSRLASGARFVDPIETAGYLELWLSIRRKAGVVGNLLVAEIAELVDAIDSGDFNQELGIVDAQPTD